MCIRTLFRKLKPGVKFALALLGILLLAAAIIVACWGLEDVLPPHMKSFLVFICGWITLFVLFWLFGGFCGRDSGIGPAQRAKTTIWN